MTATRQSIRWGPGDSYQTEYQVGPGRAGSSGPAGSLCAAAAVVNGPQRRAGGQEAGCSAWGSMPQLPGMPQLVKCWSTLGPRHTHTHPPTKVISPAWPVPLAAPVAGRVCPGAQQRRLEACLGQRAAQVRQNRDWSGQTELEPAAPASEPLQGICTRLRTRRLHARAVPPGAPLRESCASTHQARLSAHVRASVLFARRP